MPMTKLIAQLLLFKTCAAGKSPRSIEKLFHWFSTDRSVANAGKFNLFYSSRNPVNVQIFDKESKTVWN